jgi:hypothetical protein
MSGDRQYRPRCPPLDRTRATELLERLEAVTS